MRSRVCELISPLSLIARDTVCGETPAFRAISLIVILRTGPSNPITCRDGIVPVNVNVIITENMGDVKAIDHVTIWGRMDMNSDSVSRRFFVRVVIAPDSHVVGYHAGRQVIAAMQSTLTHADRFALGLATGSTPLPLYGYLISAFYAGEIDFARVHTVNLDEYVGLSPNHPQSYRYFMMHNFFRYINIPLRQTHMPNGLADDLDQECARYEQMIACMGVDLFILGIGRDAHIAFNEPGSGRHSKTRPVMLAQDTIDANARFFESVQDVPRKALSAGVSTIIDHSKELVLLATGSAKAVPIVNALMGPVTMQVPASYLREHPNCTFYVDRLAAKLLCERIEAQGKPSYLEIVLVE
jgi:glucosamine-6-phosphate deaminase